jgi:hypothetical protein
MANGQDDKVVEQIFGSAIDVLAILIAVAGLVAAAADKVAGLDYVAGPLKLLLTFIGILSFLAGATALLALGRLNRIERIPRRAVIWAMCSLIVCTFIATVWFILSV